MTSDDKLKAAYLAQRGASFGEISRALKMNTSPSKREVLRAFFEAEHIAVRAYVGEAVGDLALSDDLRTRWTAILPNLRERLRRDILRDSA